ncbi:WD40-like Beta Propeller Repeat [Gracilimonas mengyeensis]|uniref:WD40-like Beta Propeller Repeat n=2 Tax=Gracilimonas mengyeensis TaxID=1302730 RepID=A0A521CUS3_9BACT|nr:WD40-like Beta Propeller Repeat [Gracilimonas mengyeensis]
MRFFFLLIGLWFFGSSQGYGQGYLNSLQHRAPGVEWQQIHTPHFRIIFPSADDSLAYRSAAILEAQYPSVAELAGGTLKKFPVILSSFTDRSNGYVSPYNFRSEVDLAPIKGKGMNPQTGGWLETVLPHELVHASHMNVQQPLDEKKVSLSNFISLFSPDAGRLIHALVPMGVHEGLAVYHESEAITENGGRGNYPYFLNRFNANFASPDRWNMGQTFIPSEYSLPGDRHYIAGHEFTYWLQENYGEKVSRKAIRYHYHHFFLGYGFALYKKTGKWPGELYKEYEADILESEEKRLSEFEENTSQHSRIIELPFDGEEVHGPRWLTENEILYSGSFHNGRFGFYGYDIEDGSTRLVKETFMVGDYHYQLLEDKHLIYAAYTARPTYSAYYSDLYRLNPRSGKSERITQNARVHSPTQSGEKLLAIQSLGSVKRIVEVLEDGSLETIKLFSEAEPISITANPLKPEQLAVIINKKGVQALWLSSYESLPQSLDAPPTLAFAEASVFDAHWHPDGDRLLVSLDIGSTLNIYEYNLNSGQVVQITNAPYNAFEGAYSPDGSRLAYIIQQDDERKLAILDQSDFLNAPLSPLHFLSAQAFEEQQNHPLLGASWSDSLQDLKPEPYRSGLGWLKPRAVYPVYTQTAGTNELGVSLSSIDALSSQAYNIEITGIQDRLWYDVTYANKMFYPGFELQAYSDPSFTSLLVNNGRYSIMRQERGLSLSLPFSYTFRANTRLSSLYISPEVSAEQLRYFDLQPEPISDFSTRYRAGIFSQLNLGILNLRRDVQPSSGLGLFGFFERTLNKPEYQLDLGNLSPNLVLDNQWTAYYGAMGYVSPLRKWNQSLRLDLQFLQQSASPIYSNDTILPMGFSDMPFPSPASGDRLRHLGRFSTRYTIPLFYPDTGYFTVPLYVNSIYLTTFTHTLTDMNSNNLVASSRSLFGAGLHLQFKVSNLLLDLGFGIAYEPTRNNTQIILGQF